MQSFRGFSSKPAGIDSDKSEDEGDDDDENSLPYIIMNQNQDLF